MTATTLIDQAHAAAEATLERLAITTPESVQTMLHSMFTLGYLAGHQAREEQALMDRLAEGLAEGRR